MNWKLYGMNELWQEVRILNCTAELIENLVNHLLCSFSTPSNGIVTEVKPKDIVEKKMFFILLLEVFQPVHKEMLPNKKKGDSLLTLTLDVAKSPLLNSNTTDSERMAQMATNFIDWLDKEFEYSISSQNIGKDVDLMISREKALYLVGNRCKHTLVRSNSILETLIKKYQKAGIEIQGDEKTLIIDDIDNWFFDDFCGYHFTKLCELSSELYHSIIAYLIPVYENRGVFENGTLKSYNIPKELTRSDHKSEFYELLNKTRHQWIPHIKTNELFTRHH